MALSTVGIFGYDRSPARSTVMGSDSPLSARMEAHLRSASVPSVQVDRPQFFADVQALELRLAIIDDRFERLAARPTTRTRRGVATRCRVCARSRIAPASSRGPERSSRIAGATWPPS